jgi:hypothetical protein
MINWLFDNPQRLKIVAAGTGALIVIMFIAFTLTRIQHLPSANPTPSASAESTADGLLPPSPAPEEGSPLPEYGPSAPIALEAVQAFLQGDHAKFARLGQPEAVESVNDAPQPPPGQEITGDVKTLLGGPTRQKVSVPTTDGDLVLDMVVVDGAWKVMSIEYDR